MPPGKGLHLLETDNVRITQAQRLHNGPASLLPNHLFLPGGRVVDVERADHQFIRTLEIA